MESKLTNPNPINKSWFGSWFLKNPANINETSDGKIKTNENTNAERIFAGISCNFDFTVVVEIA